MVKNHDILFNKAVRLLDIANKIWLLQDKKNYAYAEKCYEDAVEITESFPDNKNVLTQEADPF